MPSTPPAPVTTENAPLDPAFLALLCCPLCPERPHLQFDAAQQLLRCPQKGHTFPFAEDSGFPDLRPPLDADTSPTTP